MGIFLQYYLWNSTKKAQLTAGEYHKKILFINYDLIGEQFIWGIQNGLIGVITVWVKNILFSDERVKKRRLMGSFFMINSGNWGETNMKYWRKVGWGFFSIEMKFRSRNFNELKLFFDRMSMSVEQGCHFVFLIAKF